MLWKISESRENEYVSNPLWESLESHFTQAINTSPLPRREREHLQRHYIRQRKGDALRYVPNLRDRIGNRYESEDLGPSDIEVIDFIINYTHDKVLLLVGPRGSGKTTLIHFVESVLDRCEDEPPSLIVFNALRLQERFDHDWMASRLREEILTHPSLAEAYSVVTELPDEDPHKLTRELRYLSEIQKRQTAQIVIVFDNLDQLDFPVAQDILSVARSAYLNFRIACIVTMRQGLLQALAESGSARAYFNYRLDIAAPTVPAWLDSVKNRLVERLTRMNARLTDRSLSPEDIARAFDGFVELMRGRHPQDDVLGVLQALAADDTRHLLLSIRRLLSSRRLPAEQLLNDAADRSEFHPLVALLEGPHRYYRPDAILPNLLCFTPDGSGPDLLLGHNVLVLLNLTHRPRSKRLVEWLKRLGHREATVRDCLRELNQAGLIRFSDVESFRRMAPLPERTFLTESGRYYVERMFATADYIVSVVVDVPLAHSGFDDRAMLVAPDSNFSRRLLSFLEYVEEVRRDEARMLRALTSGRADPTLRLLADAFRKGGLLTHKLLQALSAIHDRSQDSTSDTVVEMLRVVRDRLGKLKSWVDGSENRLEEIRNRGSKQPYLSRSVINLDCGSYGVVLESNRVGDLTDISLHVQHFPADQFVIVRLASAPGEPGTEIHLAASLNRDDEAYPALGAVGYLPDSFAGSANDLEVSVLAVPKRLTGETKKSFAVLSITEMDGLVVPVLYLGSHDHFEKIEIGKSVAREKLIAQLDNYTGEIATTIADGKRFDHLRRAMGTMLSAEALDAEGRNKLSTVYRSIDTLLIVSRDGSVPWEWMTINDGSPTRLPIGDVCRTVRWIGDPLDGVGAFLFSDQRCPVGTLVSFPRDGPVDNFEDMIVALSDCSTVHIVGRREKSGAIRVGRAKVTADLARTYNMPRSVSGVVLSSCSAARIGGVDALPAVMASESGCVVWAPVVDIHSSMATELDQALSDFAADSPNGFLDDFMRDSRAKIPALALYVRYGIKGGK